MLDVIDFALENKKPRAAKKKPSAAKKKPHATKKKRLKK